MQLIETIVELRETLDSARRSGRSVGFVPTMGYLHDGHASLMDAAGECDVVVTSIFVNPLQFAPDEDLDSYPRDLSGDVQTATRHGVDIVFAPSTSEMYPERCLTSVSVEGVSAPMEGRTRPTHFNGVATVVTKLFNIVGPCRAYFGEKDWQQLAVIRRMVEDLNIPVEVIGCPTVREDDGLAMSSRNKYLSDDERSAAPVVHRALRCGVAAILAGETDPAAVRSLMAEVIDNEAEGDLDYVEAVDAHSLATPEVLEGDVRLLAAVRFGQARLIDNVGVTLTAPTQRS